jgi:hypothetical protein
MADVFSGGFAFEFSTENANSKADAPYPFSGFGTQNYGLGYFTPNNCDHMDIPCTYTRMPNFQNLAAIYNSNRTGNDDSSSSVLPHRDQYTPRITNPPTCPTGFATLASVTWLSDSVSSLLCPDLTQTKLCPGDDLITGEGIIVRATETPATVTPGPGTDETNKTSGSPLNPSPPLTSIRCLYEANVVAMLIVTIAMVGAAGVYI